MCTLGICPTTKDILIKKSETTKRLLSLSLNEAQSVEEAPIDFDPEMLRKVN